MSNSGAILKNINKACKEIVHIADNKAAFVKLIAKTRGIEDTGISKELDEQTLDILREFRFLASQQKNKRVSMIARGLFIKTAVRLRLLPRNKRFRKAKLKQLENAGYFKNI